MAEEFINKNELLDRILNVSTTGIFASDMQEAILRVIDDMPVRQAKHFRECTEMIRKELVGKW